MDRNRRFEMNLNTEQTGYYHYVRAEHLLEALRELQRSGGVVVDDALIDHAFITATLVTRRSPEIAMEARRFGLRPPDSWDLRDRAIDSNVEIVGLEPRREMRNI